MARIVFLYPTLFEGKITVTYFRKMFDSNGTEGALCKQQLNVGSGTADSASFLLVSTLIVLQRKPSLEAKMFQSGQNQGF